MENCKPPARPGFVKHLGAFLDRVLFYPPRPPRPPVWRRFPARIHELELHFTPDGVVHELHYQQLEGETLCAV